MPPSPLAGTARPTPFRNIKGWPTPTLLSYVANGFYCVFCICSDFGLLSYVYVNCWRMSRHTAHTVNRDQSTTINIQHSIFLAGRLLSRPAVRASALRSHDSAFSLLLYIVSYWRRSWERVLTCARFLVTCTSHQTAWPLTGWMLEVTNSWSSSAFLTTHLCWLGLVSVVM